jgi:hypothetical protein
VAAYSTTFTGAISALNINLGGGLSKRKVRGPESDWQISFEKKPLKIGQSLLLNQQN